MPANFSRYLQENLLVLLTFDDERGKLIRNTVEPQLFGGFYKEIVARTYDYIDTFKEGPGEHLADLLEDKLESKDKRERGTYRDILESLLSVKDEINTEYVMSQLEGFVKRQSLRSVAIDLSKALQKDTEESLAEAEALIEKAKGASLKVFDSGTRLSNFNKAFQFLDENLQAFPTGIPEFDKRGFGPTRGEMLLYIADTKTGKTWCMIHLAKIALMNNLKTVHISLEMSEQKVAQRYMQTLFAISKRKETFKVKQFKRSKKGKLTLEEREIKPKLAFEDPNIKTKLMKRAQPFQNRLLDNIIIKNFPTGKLSLQELEAYLDMLEQTEKFVPDLLIVDYPDLMKMSKGELRHSLGEVYKGLRGVAGARHIALACPTQANRDAAGAKTVGRKNVSEAYSKIADADMAFAYSQTEMEKALGLARLGVIAGRNDEDNIQVVLSQLYGMGQYVIDSTPMDKEYDQYLEDEKRDQSYDDDDDDYDDDD